MEVELKNKFLIATICLIALLMAVLLVRVFNDRGDESLMADTEMTSVPLYPDQPVVVSSSRFYDGTWKVGEEIEPGKYLAVIPESGIDYEYDCYWARLKGKSGKDKDTIANQWRILPGEVTVTIKKSDKYFTSDGCGTWNKVSS